MTEKPDDLEMIVCGVCGANIDQKTGETTIDPDSPADSMNALKVKNTNLQTKLVSMQDRYNDLLERHKLATEGIKPVEQGKRPGLFRRFLDTPVDI